MTLDEAFEMYPEMIVVDGYDEAIIGVAERINLDPVLVYDAELLIKLLAKVMEVYESDLQDGQTIDDVKYEMALEYYEYNIKGAWVGERTPIFMEKIEY